MDDFGGHSGAATARRISAFPVVASNHLRQFCHDDSLESPSVDVGPELFVLSG